jgi:hypothetical protein
LITNSLSIGGPGQFLTSLVIALSDTAHGLEKPYCKSLAKVSSAN